MYYKTKVIEFTKGDSTKSRNIHIESEYLGDYVRDEFKTRLGYHRVNESNHTLTNDDISVQEVADILDSLCLMKMKNKVKSLKGQATKCSNQYKEYREKLMA